MNSDGTPETGPSGNDNSARTDNDIIDEVKKRFALCVKADGDNHKEALDDLNFLRGDQWPEKQRRSRESDGRPCLTINKLPTFLHQVTNEQRQNKASIKVSATGLKGNEKTAEIIQGMIRHIEYKSAADIAYDTSVNSAAAIGFGYFRLITDYTAQDSFDQEILIKRVRNPFTIFFDPASTEPDGSDAQFVIISEKMTKDEFKATYPNAQMTTSGFNITGIGDSSNQQWIWDNMVRVAEYYRFDYEQATLYMLRDGTTTFDKPLDETTVKQIRESVKKTLNWYKVTPYEILERTEIKCKWIPVFPVYGNEIDIDGVIYRSGLVRNAKDPAMMYNFWMTSATEEVSLRPKTPYIGAVGQFEGQEKRWSQANNRSFPYLEYNPVSLDGQLTPPPGRQPMVDVPVGVLTMATHAADNIKATTGLFDSSLGAQGNATSGKQEMAQQRQGNTSNYHYTDNFARTLRHAGRCIVDMIPHYYDTERVIQIMAEDGTQKPAIVNSRDTAVGVIVNDLTIGEYGVTVSVGPSYSTMRAEAADAMMQFGQSWPKLMDVAGDEVVKAMNWPGAEGIAKRIARTIPPEIRDDPEEGAPPAIPPAVQQKIQQMEEEIRSLTQEADKNHAKVTAAEISKESAIAVANIAKESAADVQEIKGWIELLVQKMQVPIALAQDVTEDLGSDDTRNESMGGETNANASVSPEPDESQMNAPMNMGPDA